METGTLIRHSGNLGSRYAIFGFQALAEIGARGGSAFHDFPRQSGGSGPPVAQSRPCASGLLAGDRSPERASSATGISG